jgi:hypothetical protein
MCSHEYTRIVFGSLGRIVGMRKPGVLCEERTRCWLQVAGTAEVVDQR